MPFPGSRFLLSQEHDLADLVRDPISHTVTIGQGATMTTFDDRERAYETKFARDEEMAFRVTARRNKLLGQWAAGLMKLTPEETEAYSRAVIQAEFEEAGDEDVVRKLLGDLTAAGVDVDDATVRKAIEDQAVEARRQLMESK
jgi:hypothetical protein